MTVATATVVILPMAEEETDSGRPVDFPHTNSVLMGTVTPGIHQLFCMLCYPTILPLSRHYTADTAVQPQCVADTRVQV